MHIAIIEYLSCTCAVPVSLTCGQLFGVKTYSCVSLLYVYSCTSLITIHPLPNILIYRQYGVHNNQYARLQYYCPSSSAHLQAEGSPQLPTRPHRHPGGYFPTPLSPTSLSEGTEELLYLVRLNFLFCSAFGVDVGDHYNYTDS